MIHEEGDIWGGVDAGTPPAAPTTPQEVPAFEVPPPPLAPLEAEVCGVVEVRKGRLAGRFKVRCLEDREVSVAVERESTFCGTGHFGSFRFRAPTLALVLGSRYLRTNALGAPTDAAWTALENGAQEAARQWLAAHPLAFEAAACLDAGERVKAGEDKVRKLRAELDQAEADAAQARLDHAAHLAAMARKGYGPGPADR